MKGPRDPWTSPAVGFLFIAVLGTAVLISPVHPTPDASNQEIARHFAEHRETFIAEIYLSGLAMVPAIWLIVILWRRLREAEGERAVLSTIALVSGVSAITVTMAASGFHVVLALEVNEPLDPALVRTLYDLGNSTLSFIPFALTALFGAIAVVALQTGALPRWLGMGAALLAVLQPPSALAMFVRSGPFAPGALFGGVTIILLMAWTLALTVVLVLEDRRRSRLAPQAAAGGG